MMCVLEYMTLYCMGCENIITTIFMLHVIFFKCCIYTTLYSNSTCMPRGDEHVYMNVPCTCTYVQYDVCMRSISCHNVVSLWGVAYTYDHECT